QPPDVTQAWRRDGEGVEPALPRRELSPKRVGELGRARPAVDQDRSLWTAKQDRLAVAHVEHAYLWRGVGPRCEGGRRDQARGDDRSGDDGLASRARQVRARDRRSERRVVGGPEPARERGGGDGGHGRSGQTV